MSQEQSTSWSASKEMQRPTVSFTLYGQNVGLLTFTSTMRFNPLNDLTHEQFWFQVSERNREERWLNFIVCWSGFSDGLEIFARDEHFAIALFGPGGMRSYLPRFHPKEYEHLWVGKIDRLGWSSGALGPTLGQAEMIAIELAELCADLQARVQQSVQAALLSSLKEDPRRKASVDIDCPLDEVLINDAILARFYDDSRLDVPHGSLVTAVEDTLGDGETVRFLINRVLHKWRFSGAATQTSNTSAP